MFRYLTISLLCLLSIFSLSFSDCVHNEPVEATVVFDYKDLVPPKNEEVSCLDYYSFIEICQIIKAMVDMDQFDEEHYKFLCLTIGRDRFGCKI